MSSCEILIVEDEFIVAESLKIDLESMGYRVLDLVPTGKEAMELARQGKPDLVLMDIKILGEMDGVETAMHLRQELDVPVVFLTAFADETLLARAKLAEPFGYLVKPYHRKGLRAGIEMAQYKARMERLLKESESRFRSMFERSPVAYLTLDESCRCLDFNPEFCNLLGYSREELTGKSLFEFRPPNEQHMHEDKSAEDEKLQLELDLVRKDGALITVLFEGRSQYNADGIFLQRHCILHNISDRKKVEAAIRSANEELEKRVEERTAELLAKTVNLEEVNIALRVLLDARAEDRKEFEKAVAVNVKKLILPYVEKLQKTQLSDNQASYLAILQSHLRDIESRFITKLPLQHMGLTPTEMQVAALIRDGKTSKEIAAALNVSEKAVGFHRNNIRRRLNLKNKKENLRSHLLNI